MLLRAFIYNPPIKEETLNQWLTDLVDAIGMKVVVPAKSKYVDAVGNAGLTGSINIETSHIAIHVWSEQVPARVEMDVYSCACFDPKTVLKKLDQFNLNKYHMMMVDRNDAEFKVTHQSDGYEFYKDTI
jgi:S-adenosylmethionine/arginine decarboxylase-like enzyme